MNVLPETRSAAPEFPWTPPSQVRSILGKFFAAVGRQILLTPLPVLQCHLVAFRATQEPGEALHCPDCKCRPASAVGLRRRRSCAAPRPNPNPGKHHPTLLSLLR